MYQDIVQPSGNEQAFIDMAQKLGYGALVFLYRDAKACKAAKNNQKTSTSSHDNQVLISFASQSLKGSGSDVQPIIKAGIENRKYFENSSVGMIYGLEFAGKKDFIHHRNAGLNQVLCKLAVQNKISIAFSLEMLDSALYMGRVMQNIRLCRKYTVSMKIASFASDPLMMGSPLDTISLGICLGMHQSEAKAAVTVPKSDVKGSRYSISDISE